MELIPAIDLKEGRVVRLLHGDFDAETRYEVTPADLYVRYASCGARHLHVVDLDGARDGTQPNLDIVWQLAAGRMAVQAGGGLRSDTALRNLFEAGVQRAVIGSIAVTDPAKVAGWLAEFGAERIVLALDVRIDSGGVPHIATHGWRELSSLDLWSAVDRFLPAGLKHVLCTDVSRDGALAGPNLDLYATAVGRFPSIAWQASGGVRDVQDLYALRAIGVTATVSGKALLEGRMTAEELQPFLPAA